METWGRAHREECIHRHVKTDQRAVFQRDKDRLLYSSAFRRLTGITQIVRAGEEEVFHNRLTHSIKVAQVGRRIAEKLKDTQEELAVAVDPDVVEAACLAHDMGHPPFGHCGEQKLNELVRAADDKVPGDDSGFEGNAQSFRIVTRLAVRWPSSPGLNLTRATLAATLKYPWLSDSDKALTTNKWGAYQSELEEFNFAMDGWPSVGRTIEAQIMDWADDITYSVHDLEDFHRCGVIPWSRLFGEMLEPSGGHPCQKPIEIALNKWTKEMGEEVPFDAKDRLMDAWNWVRKLMKPTFTALFFEKYEGTRVQRQEIRDFSSCLVDFLMKNTVLSSPVNLSFRDESEALVRLLKAVTVNHILSSKALMAQQMGQKKIIHDLFYAILRSITENGADRRWLPARFDYIISEYDEGAITARRAVADCICSLTEGETIALRNRVFGIDGGSVLHPLVR